VTVRRCAERRGTNVASAVAGGVATHAVYAVARQAIRGAVARFSDDGERVDSAHVARDVEIGTRRTERGDLARDGARIAELVAS
jgi:hypothetical protein